MNCPECHGALSIGAVKCRCGWKAADLRETYACAHDGCNRPAVLKRKVNNVAVNLCRYHDDFHVSQEAKEFCKSKGLTTVDQMRVFCKTTKVFREMPK